MRLFALEGTRPLGSEVAQALGRKLDPHEERDFEDGEHKIRPLVSVRGEDVFILHSLAGSGSASPNDHLCKLLFFIAACKENGAARVTALVPYLAYARKDRQTKARDPVTTRYVAQLFETVGTDCVVTLEVHNLAAFQNAFRCRTVHLDTHRLFVAYMVERAGDRPVTVFSPDTGGVKRAQLLKEAYEAETGAGAGLGFMEKRRSRGVVSGDLFAGDVAGSAVFIFDDMISTGGTMLRAARACRERGADSVHVLAAHGLFGLGSSALFDEGAIDGVAVTDSVAAAQEVKQRFPRAPLEVISAGALIAEAAERLHRNGSISGLLGMES
jgi:ribose-phosphate pyrophosphokinase